MSCSISPVAQNVPAFIRKNSIGRVQIEVTDENGCPTDAASLVLTVLDGADNPIYQEDYFQPVYAPNQHRIVKVPGVDGTYYIEWGDRAYPATQLGVNGVYPTGFVGGERLTLQIDNEVGTVVFQASDQTLADVVARINAVFGPLPTIGVPVAFDQLGQLLLKSKKTNSWGVIVSQPNNSTPSVFTALGLTPGRIAQGTGFDGETTSSGSWLFEWAASDGAHPSEITRLVQTVHVIPGGLYRMLPEFRNLIDKARKLVNPRSDCFLGYTDQNLLMYLMGGLQAINSYQPSVFFTFENFPYQQFGIMLLEASLLYGATSQTLFAIDTDVPQYNDQGASFTINHQAPLSQYLNSLASRLDRAIPQFKLHFVNSGTTVTQVGPSYRLQTLLSAAPSGALFRNVFFRS